MCISNGVARGGRKQVYGRERDDDGTPSSILGSKNAEMCRIRDPFLKEKGWVERGCKMRRSLGDIIGGL